MEARARWAVGVEAEAPLGDVEPHLAPEHPQQQPQPETSLGSVCWVVPTEPFGSVGFLYLQKASANDSPMTQEPIIQFRVLVSPRPAVVAHVRIESQFG